MIPRFRSAALLFAVMLVSVRASNPDHLIFVGTQAKNGGRGIYTLRLDAVTGTLTSPTLAADALNSWFLALSPDRRFLYATSESPALAVGFAVDPPSGRLTPLQATPAPGAVGPCHLAVDATGRCLLVADFQGGAVASLPLREDGTLGPPRVIRHSGRGAHPVRQIQPRVHSVTFAPDNRFALVCDFGVDRIFMYRLDPANSLLTPAEPPAVATASASGPRHFAFGRDGRHAYASNEIQSSVAAYDYTPESGTLVQRQTVSTLPADFTGPNATAEVRVHPNGKFLYASNRGHDSLAVFAIEANTGHLSFIEIVSSGGQTPRHFSLSPDGKWLVCGQQNSNLLVVFHVDPVTGRLGQNGPGVPIPGPVCVLFHD